MDYHYTWEFGRHFDFIVGPLHRANFFYFYFYTPLITVLATGLFWWVLRRTRRTHYVADGSKFSRLFWYANYYLFCWMAVGAFAVAIKMLIVEELDYQERKWFEPYLTPGHLYISSAAFAYLALITRTKSRYYHLILAIYVQIALIAGYYVSLYRMFNEDLEGAIGGFILLLFFAVGNFDLFRRVRGIFRLQIPSRTQVAAN